MLRANTVLSTNEKKIDEEAKEFERMIMISGVTKKFISEALEINPIYFKSVLYNGLTDRQKIIFYETINKAIEEKKSIFEGLKENITKGIKMLRRHDDPIRDVELSDSAKKLYQALLVLTSIKDRTTVRGVTIRTISEQAYGGNSTIRFYADLEELVKYQYVNVTSSNPKVQRSTNIYHLLKERR